MLASKADIIAYESLGYSHLVYREESYFVNLDSESSRLKFKEYLEKETGKEWGIIELDEYVFYRKDMYFFDSDCLKLNDTFHGKVEVPINASSCFSMFSHKNLEGIDFSEFDTSGVKDMSNMFSGCIFSEGFSLGNRFDTSNVENMQNMFKGCNFPEGFSLGDKFDTSSVKEMNFMFFKCAFPEGFSLGDKFDTSSVEFMDFMFGKCNLPKGFSLGDKFDTSSVEYMYSMFGKCTFPEGFSLGDKFDTSSVENMHGMFRECTFPAGFSLGDKFDTSSVENMYGMFSKTQFNEDFSLAKNFTICKKSECMFDNAKLPSRVAKRLSGEETCEEIVELLKVDSTVAKSTLVTKADFF